MVILSRLVPSNIPSPIEESPVLGIPFVGVFVFPKFILQFKTPRDNFFNELAFLNIPLKSVALEACHFVMASRLTREEQFANVKLALTISLKPVVLENSIVFNL